MLENARISYLVSFAAGALLTLAFAPFHLWPVIFLSFPALYLLLTRSETRGRALWRGFFFGYGFFMAGTWWIGNALLVDAGKFGWLLPISILGLSAAMALWFVPFAYSIYRLRLVMNPAVFAVLWAVLELFRSLGMFGFPWNLVGYVSLASLPLAQLATIIGVYGLSLVLVWVSLMPIYWHEKQPRRKLASIACVIFLVSGFFWGSTRLSVPTTFTEYRIRVVQPNIPQSIKGSQKGLKYTTQALRQLSVKPTDKDNKLSATIWPETTYPFRIHDDQPILLPELHSPLLTGAIRAEGYGRQVQIWNSFIGMTPLGDRLVSYDKHQLVPFGEFVPLRSVLPLDKITPGDIDFSRGDGPKTLVIEHLPPFSPLVCYEAIFPWMAIDKKNRPGWMLNVTNDGWYGNTAGPYQHFDMVRMRAIEQGLPMVRAANSGISAVVDARGRVVSQVGLGEKGAIDAFLPVADLPTPISRIY